MFAHLLLKIGLEYVVNEGFKCDIALMLFRHSLPYSVISGLGSCHWGLSQSHGVCTGIEPGEVLETVV